MNKTAGIASVYISMMKKTLFIITVSAAVLAAGLLIVFPIWFLAVNYPSGYSVSIAAAAVFSVLFTVFNKIRKKEWTVRTLSIHIIRIIYYFILLCGTAASVILFMNSRILQGTIVITVLFTLSGLISWLKKKQGK